MHWFERKIRRYEHRRWTTDDNRRVQPFDWGLEHIGGDPADPNPAEYVRQYAKQAIENSAEWFATTPADDYRSRPRKRPHFHQFHANRRGRKTTRSTRNSFPAKSCRRRRTGIEEHACRFSASQLERQVARPAGPLRMAPTHRDHRSQDEHALPRPPHGPEATSAPTRFVAPTSA